MEFGTFLSLTNDLFTTLIDGFNTVINVLNSPIVDDLSNSGLNSTWLGEKLLQYINHFFPPEFTYLHLMFGAGITLLISITIVKWIIGIVM